MKQFFQANKVLLFGLIGSIAIVIQQFTIQGPIDYKVLALAALIAAIGFLAKNLRGQWATILSSLLPSLGVIFTAAQDHTPISWMQIFASAGLAISGVFAPPPKSLEYEKAPEIMAAKQEAATIDAANRKSSPASK